MKRVSPTKMPQGPRRQLSVLAGLMFGVGLTLSAAHAAELEGTEPGNGGVSQLDNPRYTGIPLTLFGFEEMERIDLAPGGVRHWLNRMQLHTGCGEQNPFCVARDLFSVVPVEAGLLLAGTHEVQAFGAQLGHFPSNMRIERDDNLFNTTFLVPIEARVDRETIIVPVHVVVEVPESGGLMEQFADASLYRALFDDDFGNPNGTFTVSHPGEGFEQHITAFSQPVPELGAASSETFVRGHPVKMGSITELQPDDIWAQCGIQFRLASVTRLNVQEIGIRRNAEQESLEMNTAVSSLKKRSLGQDALPGDSVELLYGNNNGQGVYVGIMTFASNQTFVGAAQGRSSGPVAGIGVADISTVRPSATLSHEIGHVLGVTGPDEGHPQCSGEDAKQLMCNLGGGGSFHLGGCDVWRDGVEDRGGICLPGTECQTTAELPVNCHPTRRPLAVSVCETARNGASGWSNFITGNSAPTVTLADQAGVPLNSSAVTAECGGELVLRREVSVLPDDPFPEEARRLSGWTVTYLDSSNNITERIEFDWTQSELVLDMSYRPDDRLDVAYHSVDAQGTTGRDDVSVLRILDTLPPEIELLAREPIAVANPDLTVVEITPPAATDACSEPEVSGQLLTVDGVPVPSTTPLGPGGSLEVRPGLYEILWTAVDDQGLAAEVTEVVEVVLVADASIAQANERVIEGNGPQASIVDETSDDKFVLGSSGGDIVLLGAGDDRIFGRDGADHLNGGGGSDELIGGEGADMLNCNSPGHISAYGAEGADYIQALWCGGSTLFGGADADFINGSGADDVIYPGPGMDTVTAAGGDDVVVLLDVCELSSGKMLVGGSGTDTLVSPVSQTELASIGVTVSGFETFTVDASRTYLASCFGQE